MGFCNIREVSSRPLGLKTTNTPPKVQNLDISGPTKGLMSQLKTRQTTGEASLTAKPRKVPIHAVNQICCTPQHEALGPVYAERQCQRCDIDDDPDQFGFANYFKVNQCEIYKQLIGAIHC